MTETQQHIKTLNTNEYVLINSICDRFNIIIDDLIGKRRNRKFANARKVATHILYKNGYTLNQIGKLISLIPKDHTSIMHLRDTAKNHYENELEFKNIVDSISFSRNKQSFTSLKFKPCN